MLFLLLVDRSEFMIDLKNTLTSLINSQLMISELKEQQESLISSARTRLKWAAGSNPVINDVSSIFFLVLVIHFVYGICKQSNKFIYVGYEFVRRTCQSRKQ